MNALLLATLVLGAAASEAGIEASAEYSGIMTEVQNIVKLIQAVEKEGSSLIQLEEDDWISYGPSDAKKEEKTEGASLAQFDDKVDEDIFEPFDEKTESRIVERVSGLRKNPPKGHHLHKTRACKTFTDTRFKFEGRVAVVSGSTYEACLASCEENLACAQIVFDKTSGTCEGRAKSNSKLMSGVKYAPTDFVTGQCETVSEENLETSKPEASLMEQQAEETKQEAELDADAEFEKMQQMEEQLAKQEEEALPAAKYFKPIVKKAKQTGLKLKQKVTKKQTTRKCNTFETENLVKKGSLLQMGKKLLTSASAGDFLSCLQMCQKDVQCKQVVYDKQASQCYKHDTVTLTKTNAKHTKYIAATCQ